MYSPENSVFTMPLPLEAHQIAQQFRQHQSDHKKAKQVYLNTLAVYAVHRYLSWLGIATNLEASDSWNAIAQTLSDVADLQVEGKGKLECRPVLPTQSVCSVPAEVWAERIGFVAVQLDADLREATLLGFVPTVVAEELPLDRLHSLDELIDRLGPIENAKPISAIGQWLQGKVEAGWSTVEAIWGQQPPALSFRSANSIDAAALTLRAKLFSLAPNLPQLALVIGVMPLTPDEVDVWVKLCPLKSALQLPPELELSVLDAAGIAVMQAQARSTEMIQLKFSATWAEQFSIKIMLGDTSVVEAFVV